MNYNKPAYCKGCLNFHSADRQNANKHMKQFNAWCCAKGSPAAKSVGWCKLHKKKRLKDGE